MFKLIFRLIRLAFVAALGAAVAAKFMLESHAQPDTQEIDLVSIFDGQQLISAADPFYGGKILTMFGGVMLDLRKAQPAPTGIHLDLLVVMGGVSLIVPEGWRVKAANDLKIFAGGFSDGTKTTSDDDVPTVTVKGLIAMGGFQATTKSPVEVMA